MPIRPDFFADCVDDSSSNLHPIAPLATSITAFVGSTLLGPVNSPIAVRSIAEFEQIFGGLSRASPLSYAVSLYFQNGGSVALIVRVGDTVLPGSHADQTGIYALDKVDQFNLLCLPRFPADGDIAPAIWGIALAYCVNRRAMLLVDPPSDWSSPVSATQELPRLMSSLGGARLACNAALYFPRIKIPDLLNANRPFEFVPCGAVAGIIAANDANRGVWTTPAGGGARLTGMSGLVLQLNDAEASPLNSLGINCLRLFPQFGDLVWGARTLAGADPLNSDWKYLFVRRFGQFLEESINRGTQWALFEPNAEPLWAQIRLSIGAFLLNLFRQGALQGATPRDAFFVKCDAETTTQSDIDKGIVNIHIGFAPLKPAEFVIFEISQIAGSQSGG